MASRTPGNFMAAEIVQNDHIALRKRRGEDLFDVGAEDVAIHGAVDDQRRGEPGCAQTGNESRGLPVPVRDRRNQTLPARSAPVSTCHVGGRPGLVDEDQPIRI